MYKGLESGLNTKVNISVNNEDVFGIVNIIESNLSLSLYCILLYIIGSVQKVAEWLGTGRYIYLSAMKTDSELST